MQHPPLHDGIAAGSLYNDASRKLILSFKHGGRIAMAPMLARLIVARLPETDESWLVVPVPLHRWRLWRRGYNQSALLAREVARLRDLDFAVDALVRHKPTPALGGMGRAARRRALSGAIGFAGRAQSKVEGKNIVLVDDVLTSGATSEACVKALKHGGALKVVIACAARVLDEAVEAASGRDRVRSANETPGMQDPGRHVTK